MKRNGIWISEENAEWTCQLAQHLPENLVPCMHLILSEAKMSSGPANRNWVKFVFGKIRPPSPNTLIHSNALR